MKITTACMLLCMISSLSHAQRLQFPLHNVEDVNDPYKVGITRIMIQDYSRSTDNKFDYKRDRNSEAKPFSFVIMVWYPAENKKYKRDDYISYAQSRLMTEADIDTLTKEQEALLALKNLSYLDTSIAHRVIKQLYTNSVYNAKPLVGKFPLVISNNGASAGLNEFIAGQGYVVASIVSDLPDRIAIVNEPAWDFNEAMHNVFLVHNYMASNFKNVDNSKTALMGFSYYGAMMQLIQMRSASFDAIITLDGTEAWKSHSVNLMSSMYFKPYLAITPILRLHNASQPDVDWSYFYEKAINTDRWIVSMKNINHGLVNTPDLTLSLDVLKGKKFDTLLFNKQQLMWSYIVNFLNYYVKDIKQGLTWMIKAMNEPTVQGVEIKLDKAAAVHAPTNAVLKRALTKGGVDALRTIHASMGSAASLLTVQALYNLSYEFRFTNRKLSIGVMRFAVELYPQSVLAKYRLAVYCSQEQQVSFALQIAEEALKLHKASPAVSDLNASQAERLAKLISEWRNQ